MSNIVISPESGILEFNYNDPSGSAINVNSASIRLHGNGGNSFITGGNVGIGSSNPAYKLDVAGDIQAKDSVVLAGTQAARGYSFHDLGTTWGYKALTSPGRLAVLVQGIEAVTFESNGRVGIGSTNPQVHKLEVAGSISGSGNFLGTGIGNRITAADGKPYLVSGDAAASLTLQNVTDNGNTTTNNIGIGTNSPNAELEIAASEATIRLTDSDLTRSL